MVCWYHAIFTAYGFWLPNDPRGSWSDFVASWELLKFGDATKTERRESLAREPHDYNLRRAAKSSLTYPPVRFNEHQRICIADGFARVCEESNLVLHACAIGFDHVHIVTARHTKTIEQVVAHLKGRSTQAMRAAGCHPMQQTAQSEETLPSPWAKSCWRVYINDQQQLRAAIRYVQRHPQKEGLPPQRYSFVKLLFV